MSCWTRQSAPGAGFLSELCLQWEAAANRAVSLGVRVVNLRIGTVLGPEGGALLKLARLFRWGLGGQLGSGKQHQPWIHLEDLLALISAALSDERYAGPINATAPGTRSNRAFTQVLGGPSGGPRCCARQPGRCGCCWARRLRWCSPVSGSDRSGSRRSGFTLASPISRARWPRSATPRRRRPWSRRTAGP